MPSALLAQVKADYRDGVLRITAPWREKTQPQRIEVRSGKPWWRALAAGSGSAYY